MNISNYSCGDSSVCREKRQFTVYLYEILERCTRVKIDKEGFANKNYEVEDAFYEPALLRECFDEAADKEAFNRELIAYADAKLKDILKTRPEGVKVEDAQIGAESKDEVYILKSGIPKDAGAADLTKHINGWGKAERSFRNPLARWMMNAKPDIALLLKRKGVKKKDEFVLCMTECVYIEGDEKYTFLCETAKGKGYRVTVSKRFILDQVLELLIGETEGTIKLSAGDGIKPCSLEAGGTSTVHLKNDRNPHSNGLPLTKISDYRRKLVKGDKTKEVKLVLSDGMELNI